MTTMLQSLFVFHVGIVFLCIVTDTRGQQSVFATNETYEWLNAKQRCTLLKDEKSIASSNFSTTLGWTNFSAKYLPWVEYKGCFKIWRTVNNFQEKQVTEGEQLQECMVHCNTSKLFGLQNSTCICIFTSNLTELFELSCDKNVATCSGDPFAFCGTEGRRGYFSMYQIVNIDREPRYKHGHIGNCLEMDTHWNFKANKCLTQSIPLCYDDVYSGFKAGTTTDWRNAFNKCPPKYQLASFRITKSNIISITANFWLSNTRRWTRMIDVTENPFFCVAARIKPNGDVERIIRRCRNRLSALCVSVRKTSTDASSNTSSTLSRVTSFSSRIEQTSTTLQRNTFQSQTISSYSTSLRSTLSSQYVSTTPALKTITSISKVVDLSTSLSTPFVSTTSVLKIPTGRSKAVKETTSSTPDLKENTSPVLEESTSTDLPGKDGVSAILIIAIVAATILIFIVILVTIVLCRRKKSTLVPISNESLAMVGKEVVYAQVNKPTVKREQSTSSLKPQGAAFDDTYDHMDHRRLSQTHNSTESNYDTIRSIANVGEEENNYDHVTGTQNEPKQFVVDVASNYSHVEVEFHEVKDI